MLLDNRSEQFGLISKAQIDVGNNTVHPRLVCVAATGGGDIRNRAGLTQRLQVFWSVFIVKGVTFNKDCLLNIVAAVGVSKVLVQQIITIK